MRPERIDDRLPQSDVREPDLDETSQSQLTPARRAALDAMKREFHDLLQAVTQ